jgi:hypothetical protein
LDHFKNYSHLEAATVALLTQRSFQAHQYIKGVTQLQKPKSLVEGTVINAENGRLHGSAIGRDSAVIAHGQSIDPVYHKRRN